MNNPYVQALIDSLKKKIEVLEQIHVKDEEQYALAGTVPFPTEAFDKNSDEKGVLIYKLNKLDEGFGLVYDKVRQELTANKSAYIDEIREMQALITRITDLSTQIQAEEARNKAKMESAFSTERKKIKQNRSSVRAINSYAQAMKNFPIN